MKTKGLSNLNNVIREIAHVSTIIEKAFYRYCKKEIGQYDGIFSIIKYSLNDIGLRIRPFLLKNTYEIDGSDFNKILPLAVAIELMQISTLITDDILDESLTRNKLPTVAKKWGYKKGFLIAECLKSLASFSLIESTPDDDRGTKIRKLFEKTYLNVCLGQIEDLNIENLPGITERQYINMIEKTTARFIQTPIEIGTILSGYEPDIEKSLNLYGVNLGYAYQIRDDVIDLIGDPKCTGKPFAIDIKQRKAKLPLVHLLSNAVSTERSHVISIMRKDYIDDNDALEIIEIMNEYGSINYSIRKCEEYCSNAIRKLSCLPDCKQKSLFIGLANLIAKFDN